MYSFRDLTQNASNTNEIPLEAVSFGGICLDEAIQGFTTLDIQGRYEFQQSFTAPTKVGDGDYYLNSRIESKTISVNFWLQANNINDFNDKVTKLKQILSQKQQQLSFKDESHWHYIATVSSLNFDDDSLTPTGKITFKCCSPFKFKDVTTISGSGSQIVINDNDLFYLQTPKYLKFTADNTAPSFQVSTNDGKQISSITGVKKGDIVEINFNDLTYLVNSDSQLMNVDLSSNFSDFYIKNGTVITFNSSGTYEMKYEVKRL